MPVEATVDEEIVEYDCSTQENLRCEIYGILRNNVSLRNNVNIVLGEMKSKDFA